jgi:hypothetical protein
MYDIKAKMQLQYLSLFIMRIILRVMLLRRREVGASNTLMRRKVLKMIRYWTIVDIKDMAAGEKAL